MEKEEGKSGSASLGQNVRRVRFSTALSERPHMARRDTPCWKCVIHFLRGTGQSRKGKAFVQSPVLQVHLGVSGDAF